MDFVGMSAPQRVEAERSELRGLRKTEHAIAMQALQFEAALCGFGGFVGRRHIKLLRRFEAQKA
jgi:hypothetical protein